MKEKPDPSSNILKFSSEQKERRFARDACATAVLQAPRDDISDSKQASTSTYEEYVPKYATDELEAVIDEHLSSPGRFHPHYIRTVAEEYLKRRGIEFSGNTPETKNESAGFHRKGLPNAELKRPTFEKPQDDLSDLREATLEAFFHLENHVIRSPELGIRQAEVNEKMDKYLKIFERDGGKSLRNELIVALDNSESETWGDRDTIEKYLGLFHAYLSIMGDDEGGV